MRAEDAVTAPHSDDSIAGGTGGSAATGGGAAPGAGGAAGHGAEAHATPVGAHGEVGAIDPGDVVTAKVSLPEALPPAPSGGSESHGTDTEELADEVGADVDDVEELVEPDDAPPQRPPAARPPPPPPSSGPPNAMADGVVAEPMATGLTGSAPSITAHATGDGVTAAPSEGAAEVAGGDGTTPGASGGGSPSAATPPASPPGDAARSSHAGAPPPTPSAAGESPHADAVRAALLAEAAPDRLAFLERELQLEPDRARRATVEHEIAELIESQLRDEAAAVKRYGRALGTDPTLRPNLWALRRICLRRGLWQNLLQLIEAEIKFSRGAAERAELLVERGVLLADRLGDAAAARASFEQAMALAPRSLPALMALEKIALRDGDVGALADLVRRQADATQDPGRRALLLVDLARLEESLPGAQAEEAPRRALALLREAFGAGAAQDEVLREMERVAAVADRRDDALEALELRVGLLAGGAAGADDPRRAEEIAAVRRRQAELLLGHERSADDATRAWRYLESAREALPGDPLVLSDLARLAGDEGRHAELATLLGQLADGAPEAARPRLRFDQARALRRAGRPDEALAVEAELERLSPGSVTLLVARQLEALRAGDLPVIAALLVEEAELALGGRLGPPDAAWAASAFAMAAAVQDRRGAADEAVALDQRALAARPGWRPSVDALDRRFARAGRHADRARLLEGELPGATPVRARYLLEELLALRADALGDTEGALRAAEALAALDPADLRARARLVELARAAGRWSETTAHLAALADRLAAVGAVDRAVEARLERAAVLERHLGDAGGALAAYEEIVRAAPAHPRAIAELKRLHATAGRYGELARVIEREMEAGAPAPRMARLLVELADLQERHLGRPDEAARIYRELVDRVPGHPAALRALGRTHVRAGDAEGLVMVGEALAAGAPSPSARARELVELGEVLEDRLGNVEQSDDAYARSMEQQPSPHAAFGRYRALVRRRDYARLEPALAALDDGASAPARAALAEERAFLLAGPGDSPETAEARLASVGTEGHAGTSPDGAPTRTPVAVDLLRARLAARRGDARLLGDVLGRTAAATRDDDLGAALALRSAVLAATTGGEASPAAATVLRRGAGQPALLAAAAELHVDADALARRAALAEGDSAVEWRLEHVEALEGAGRLAEAATAIGAALAVAPEHVALLEAQRRVALAGGDRLGHARATARLAAVLRDDDLAAARYGEAAALLYELGDVTGAAVAWRAVLTRRPLDDDAYRKAHDILVALGDAGSLDALVSDRLLHVTDGQALAGLLFERAELRRRTGQPRRAMEDYRDVLAAEPQHLDALVRLAGLTADDGDALGALKLYDRYTELCTDPAALHPAHLRAAELYEQTGDAASAIRNLQRALDDRPGDRGVLERLAALHLAQGDHSGALAQLRLLVRGATDRAERVRLEQRIADVHLEGLHDPRGAREALARALDEEPLHLDLIARIVPLCEAQGERQLKESILARAAAEARGIVTADPARVDAVRALERIAAWRGDDDQRRITSQVAALLSFEPPPPHAAAPAIEPSRELPAAAWERVMPPYLRGVALDVWREAEEASVRIYGPELASLGAGKERVNAKGIPLAWVPVDKIARALGVTAYDLYVTPGRADTCVTVGKALVLGPAHADKLTPATRFRVAHELVLLRDRLGPLETIDDSELELFFAACARVAGVPWRPPSAPSEARVEERSKQVQRALDRRARKALTALGPRFGEIGPLGAWREGLMTAAAKVALAVGGDVAASFGELSITMRDGLARTLLDFALGDELEALRRDLGLRG